MFAFLTPILRLGRRTEARGDLKIWSQRLTARSITDALNMALGSVSASPAQGRFKEAPRETTSVFLGILRPRQFCHTGERNSRLTQLIVSYALD